MARDSARPRTAPPLELPVDPGAFSGMQPTSLRDMVLAAVLVAVVAGAFPYTDRAVRAAALANGTEVFTVVHGAVAAIMAVAAGRLFYQGRDLGPTLWLSGLGASLFGAAHVLALVAGPDGAAGTLVHVAGKVAAVSVPAGLAAYGGVRAYRELEAHDRDLRYAVAMAALALLGAAAALVPFFR